MRCIFPIAFWAGFFPADRTTPRFIFGKSKIVYAAIFCKFSTAITKISFFHFPSVQRFSKQQRLYFLPLPHGHLSLRPILGALIFCSGWILCPLGGTGSVLPYLLSHQSPHLSQYGSLCFVRFTIAFLQVQIAVITYSFPLALYAGEGVSPIARPLRFLNSNTLSLSKIKNHPWTLPF